jgi:hypothetical protein
MNQHQYMLCLLIRKLQDRFIFACEVRLGVKLQRANSSHSFT